MFGLTTKKNIAIVINWVVMIYLVTTPAHLTAQTLKSDNKNNTKKSFSWPLQIEARVPNEPTVFPSGQHLYLFYELYLTNFGSSPIRIKNIEVVDADEKVITPIATFDASQLQTMIRSLGATGTDSIGKLTITPGKCAIIFMQVTIDRKTLMPDRILHRIISDNDTLNCGSIQTHQTNLQVFGPPLKGKDWLANDAPSNDESNHHRRGIIILDGLSIHSRRYAIDWQKVKDGKPFLGDSRNVNAYFCYGEPVFAVADGQVIEAKDGLPDNIPGHGESFHPAVPITFETLGGNSLVIDHGNSHFAHYLHLKPGSLLVKAGDRVKKGQLIANIGASGDAREPHLHFEVTTSPTLLHGEGLPYVIDRYRLSPAKNGAASIHINELPLDDEIVDFGEHKVEK
ncbi:Peptidase M23 [Flavobacteriaceae bacterium]